MEKQLSELEQKIRKALFEEAKLDISELECIIKEIFLSKAKWCIENKAFGAAAIIYKALGNEEEAKELFEKAAEQEVKKGAILLAVKYYIMAGNPNKAAKILEEYIDKKIESGQFTIAAEICETLAEIYKELDKEIAKKFQEKAGDLYMKGGWFSYAARAYKIAGNNKKEEKAWKKEIERLKNEASSLSSFCGIAKIYKRIAEIYENELRDPERAKKARDISGIYYMKCGLEYNDPLVCENAIEEFKKSGNLENEIMAWLLLTIVYLKKKDYLHAAEAFSMVRSLEEKLKENKQ